MTREPSRNSTVSRKPAGDGSAGGTAWTGIETNAAMTGMQKYKTVFMSESVCLNEMPVKRQFVKNLSNRAAFISRRRRAAQCRGD